MSKSIEDFKDNLEFHKALVLHMKGEISALDEKLKIAVEALGSIIEQPVFNGEVIPAKNGVTCRAIAKVALKKIGELE